MNHIYSKLKEIEPSIEIYQVGGCVRDELIKLKPKDIDYVVTGATPEILKKAGLIQVGSGFPCFIDTKTKQEYALARTEIKTGVGYNGFSCIFDPSVTLTRDLERRDLTINSIAKDINGNYIDPFNGMKDLAAKVLRHTSIAFKEDPLRVLRVARFAARYHHLGFTVAPETIQLMKEISSSNELFSLTPERVWQETKKALEEKSPHIYLEILKKSGALKDVFPEIEKLFGIPQPEKYHPEIDTGVHTLMVLKKVSLLTNNTETRFAALVHDLGKGVSPKEILPSHRGHEKAGVPIIKRLCKRLKMPNKYIELAIKVSEFHLHCHKAFELKASTVLKLIINLDGLRKPELFDKFLICCQADAQGRKGLEHNPYPQVNYLRECLTKVKNLNLQNIIKQNMSPEEIREAIITKRIDAIKQVDKSAFK
jgi:tRNA nucleotidyltransferase (CCA-adding enzyme)